MRRRARRGDAGGLVRRPRATLDAQRARPSCGARRRRARARCRWRSRGRTVSAPSTPPMSGRSEPPVSGVPRSVSKRDSSPSTEPLDARDPGLPRPATQAPDRRASVERRVAAADEDRGRRQVQRAARRPSGVERDRPETDVGRRGVGRRSAAARRRSCRASGPRRGDARDVRLCARRALAGCRGRRPRGPAAGGSPRRGASRRACARQAGAVAGSGPRRGAERPRRAPRGGRDERA